MVDDEVEVLLIHKVEDQVEQVDILDDYEDMVLVIIQDEMLIEIHDQMLIGIEHILKIHDELLHDEVGDVVMVLDEDDEQVEHYDENDEI
ncbi:hypothetical protein HOG21_00500 [bacterium]|jgi:hypothetical protein|nr:hypothetical protein [bacterium]